MKNTAQSKLNKRLLCASEFVRQDAYFADIGTDHAYLPLFLLESGRIKGAVAADINKGPLEVAKKNAREMGVFDKISFVLTDGARGLSDMGITDYAICGMGGELISDIIESSPHLKDKAVRLILGPMSKQAHLRRYLAKNGFSIVREAYSCDVGKYYLTLVTEYTGRCEEIGAFEAEFGNLPPRAEFSPEMTGYIETKIKALKKIIRGKKRGNAAIAEEEELLLKFIKRVGENLDG